jgi:tetratricopeptide (TPR) repeat protein
MLVVLLLLALAGGRQAPSDARGWLSLARTYAGQKDSKSALEAAARAEALGSEDPAVLHELARFYAEVQSDFAKAAALESRYAEKTPEDRAAWPRVAGLYLEAGDTAGAVAAAERGLRAGGTAELHSVLGRAYAQRREWAKAVAELTEALRLDPYSEDAHFRLAQVHLVQQDFPAALRVLENSRKFFDKSPQIELALGVTYYGLRRFPEAVSQFLKTIDLAPAIPQPYVFLGRIMEHAEERLPELTARFANLHAKQPDNYLGYMLHAKALISKLPPAGIPPEASAAFDLLNKSLSLKEDDAEAHYLLGLLLERRNEFEQAASHLERSVALNPKDPAPHYRLARVYARLGRKEDSARERALHEKLGEEENMPERRGVPPKPRP